MVLFFVAVGIGVFTYLNRDGFTNPGILYLGGCMVGFAAGAMLMLGLRD